MLSLTATGTPNSGGRPPGSGHRPATASASANRSAAGRTVIQTWSSPRAAIRSSTSRMTSAGCAPARYRAASPARLPNPAGSRPAVSSPAVSATALGPGHADPSAASRAEDGAIAPNTPPCMVIIFSAASWLSGSVAAVQSVSSRHS